MADDKKAEEEAARLFGPQSPFALGAGSPLAPGAGPPPLPPKNSNATLPDALPIVRSALEKKPLDSDTALGDPELSGYGYRTTPSEKTTVSDPTNGDRATISGHESLPKNWVEAVPAILFGFYGLAFAFEAVSAMNRGDMR